MAIVNSYVKLPEGTGMLNDLNEHKPMWWEQNLHEIDEAILINYWGKKLKT